MKVLFRFPKNVIVVLLASRLSIRRRENDMTHDNLHEGRKLSSLQEKFLFKSSKPFWETSDGAHRMKV